MAAVFFIAVFVVVIGFVSAFMKGLHTLLPNTIQRMIQNVSNGIDELMKSVVIVLFPYIFGYIGHLWSTAWMLAGACLGLIAGIGIRQAISEQQTLSRTIKELQESKTTQTKNPTNNELSQVVGKAEVTNDSDDDYSEEYYAGHRALELGDYALASIHFSAAITKNPNEGLYYVELADCQETLGDHAPAIESLTHALRCDPNHHFLHGSIAKLRFETKDYLGTVIDLTTAIARISDEFKVGWYADRGRALLELGAYEKSVADFSRAIQAESNETDKKGGYFGDRARALVKLESFDSALHDFTEAHRLDPENACWIGERGALKMGNRDFHGAIADYARALELDPDCVAADWKDAISFTAEQMNSK